MATDSANPLDTFTVALADSVDLSHAPTATNDSERLLFRQLFPTLIRVDCSGRVQPDLATSWHRDSAGHTWTFVLSPGARLPNGTPLTASVVSAGWRRRWAAVHQSGLDSVEVAGPERLVAMIRGSGDSPPRLFADPRLAVTPADAPLERTPLTLRAGQGQPVVEVEVFRTGDLRDALDAGADLVVSRDPAIIEYAAGRAEFETFALPWDRTYVLLQHVGREPVSVSISADSVRRSLAYDAVRSDARPAQPPFWWHSPCALFTSMKATVSSAPRLVYARSDPVARQLAERIAALAGDSLQLKAVGMDANAFSAALGQGGDRAYIVAVPHRPLLPCAETAAWTRGTHLEPLIDTRSRAIVRRGSPPLTVDWDGTVRVEQAADGERSP